MTESVSVYEAKTHLSKLLARVEAGEDFVITRNGKPVATIAAAPVRRPIDALGKLKGQIWMAEGWDEFTEQDARDWFDGAVFPPETADE